MRGREPVSVLSCRCLSSECLYVFHLNLFLLAHIPCLSISQLFVSSAHCFSKSWRIDVGRGAAPFSGVSHGCHGVVLDFHHAFAKLN